MGNYRGRLGYTYEGKVEEEEMLRGGRDGDRGGVED